MEKEKEFQQLDVEKLFEKELNREHFKDLMKSMLDIKSFLNEIEEASKEVESIPIALITSIDYYKSKFFDHYTRLSRLIQVFDGEFDEELDSLSNEIQNWISRCLSNKPIENYLSFLDTYNTIKNYKKKGIGEKNMKKVTPIKVTEIYEDFLENKKTQEKIMSEIRKFSGEIMVSTYAQVFEGSSKRFNKASYFWLAGGVLSIATLFTLILAVNWSDLVPTEKLTDNGTHYFISNILMKSLLFGVLVFLIGFFFKQYAINKHNSVVNQHRMNAMNAYQLFIQSIEAKDTSIRYAIMEILGRAIYEHVSTGFINEKSHQINSGIVEVTKMMGSNKLD